MLDIDISRFIKEHQLPNHYQQLSQQWFTALAESIALHHVGAGNPIVVGINGAQGSGKSTLADLLSFILHNHFKLNTVSLSIDDFYFTRDERQALSNEVHPLLMTRGVPGTHDVSLALETINALQSHQAVTIPRFNKATDDRAAATAQDQITKPTDVILLEGWCVGAEAQTDAQLLAPVNTLEQLEDPDSTWRQYINQQLKTVYPALFSLVDRWVMLKAPSFECVFNWRLEQEDKLLDKVGNQQGVMNKTQVARFIQFYQRYTEHTLKTLPSKVHDLFELDDQRQIINMVTKPITTKPSKKAWLIFTDMDGSLLDHYTYAFDDAKPTLGKLDQLNIPVIPITSKTEAELTFLRKSLNNQHPFIIENGAAIFIPQGYFEQQPEGTIAQGDYWVKAFVDHRQHWQTFIAKAGAQFKGQFTTFTKAGVEGIMQMTSLDKEAASRAAQRQYGEPLAWSGSVENKQQFIAALRAMGANILEGGRFIHVSGDSDKGQALTWLAQAYQAQTSDASVSTIALGDSHNDIAMLAIADHAVLIRSPVHAPPTIARDEQLFISTHTGPKGWAEGIHHFIGATLAAE